MPAILYERTMKHALSFKAPDETQTKLQRIAEKETTKVSERIRTWLEIFIEDYEQSVGQRKTSVCLNIITSLVMQINNQGGIEI